MYEMVGRLGNRVTDLAGFSTKSPASQKPLRGTVLVLELHVLHTTNYPR